MTKKTRETDRSRSAPSGVLASAVALLLSLAANAQPALPTPGAHAGGPQNYLLGVPLVVTPPQGGLPLAFPSPQQEGGTLSIPGVLFRPTGAAKGAVVIVNSTPGWSDFREGHYGRALSSAGYAVLAINTYEPRGFDSTIRDNGRLSTHAQTLDAFAARRYLISLGYAADRMAVMGTGRGGTIALLAADRTFVRSEKDRFVLSMSISGGCIFHPRKPSPASKVFLAIGEQDEVSGVESCRHLAKEYAAAGGDVTVKLYPGAASGFDGHPAVLRVHRQPGMETFAECLVAVEPDGRSTFGGRTFAERDTNGLIAEMRKHCIRLGGLGWTNPTQKANVTLDLIEFLDLNFRL